MPVYPTRRTACYPKEVYDTAKSGGGQDRSGWLGAERARSIHRALPDPQATASRRSGTTNCATWVAASIACTTSSRSVRTASSTRSNRRNTGYSTRTSIRRRTTCCLRTSTATWQPATLEGNTTLVHEPVDQVKQERSAWQYNSGSRRVRRAPELGYDNIGNASDGLRTFDQVDMYNGSPDRYDWKLVGKKEIYIPYNAYKLDDKSLKYKDIIQKNVLKSDLFRYELHRVWVVEATLRKRHEAHLRQAHVLPRRGHVADRLRGCARLARRPVESRHRADDAVLRCEGAVLPRQHLARPGQRRVPGVAADQRDQRALDVRPEGQVGRVPARRAAPRWHEVADLSVRESWFEGGTGNHGNALQDGLHYRWRQRHRPGAGGGAGQARARIAAFDLKFSDEARARLRKACPDALFFEVDVRDAEGVDAAVRKAVARSVRLTSPSIPQASRWPCRFSRSRANATISWSTSTSRAAAISPRLCCRTWVVAVAGARGFLAGVVSNYGYAAYSSSKFGVVGLATALRIECKTRGICVSVICPPEVETPMVEEERRTAPAVTMQTKQFAGTVTLDDLCTQVLRGWSGTSS